MEISKRKQRRLVRRLVWLVGGGVLLLVALPVWFPWVLKPLLGRYGISYRNCQRQGYFEFVLTDVKADWSDLRLHVARVQVLQPLAWAWCTLARQTNSQPLLSVANLELSIMTGHSTETNSASGSSGQVLQAAAETFDELRLLLPSATITNATVSLDSNVYFLPAVIWSQGRLETAVVLPHSNDVIRGELNCHHSKLGVALRSERFQAAIEGEFQPADGAWLWVGQLHWRSNLLAQTARFQTNSWWPVEAKCVGTNFILPTELLRLRGYHDSTGSVVVDVVSNRFKVQASGKATPTSVYARQGFPPADFAIGLQGDSRAVELTRFQLNAPWVNAALSQSVGLTWSGELLAAPAEFRVTADLGQFPGTKLAGAFTGQVTIHPHGAKPPVARFDLSGSNVHFQRLDVSQLNVAGAFAFPKLEVATAKVEFVDGSTFAASGHYDFEARALAEGQWRFSGDLPKLFVTNLNYQQLEISGRLGGSITNLAHDGKASLEGLDLTGLNPIDAELAWRGHQLEINPFEISFTARQSTCSLAGSLGFRDVAGRELGAILTNVTFVRAGQTLLAMPQPCDLEFEIGETNGAAHWRLELSGLQLLGGEREVDLAGKITWPQQGDLALAATNLAASEFSDFFARSLPTVVLPDVLLQAHWTNGPLNADFGCTAMVSNDQEHFLTLRSDISMGEQVRIRKFILQSDYTPAVTITGSVPVQICLGQAEPLLKWQAAEAIAIDGSWHNRAGDSLNVPLGDYGRIEVSQPQFDFKVTGTPEAPSASAHLAASRLAWQTESTNAASLPTVETLDLRVGITPEQVDLEQLTATLEGQQLQARGVWPMDRTNWLQLWVERKTPDWSQACGHLELTNAELSVVSRYIPRLLSPEGRLSASLDLMPGKSIGGFLSLTNAATRPVGQLAALRDISANVRLHASRAELETFRGKLGGQPVTADGFVSGIDSGKLSYELNLQGTDMPLARSLDLLLRGDFDVHLSATNNAEPTVSGVVALHDGLYLQHATGLVWSGPKRPELRPPYFSVTNEALADWKLDLILTGDRFLRVRTPVFNGLVSANMQLRGPLREPVLTGDLRVNSGRLDFPFGSLDVTEGFASFSGDDPRGPELRLMAAGRNYRYEVRMEVRGPANDAGVSLSSTPPLNSEEILLMLTAGELPQSDYVYSTRDRAGRLATFLGQDLLSRYLGSSPSEDRLIIRSGESISQEGRLTYSVEYRLTDRWSVVGEYDEYNAFNTDLKWKIFAR